MKIIFFPAAQLGSLGDEAMTYALLNALAKKAVKGAKPNKVYFVQPDPSSSWAQKIAPQYEGKIEVVDLYTSGVWHKLKLIFSWILSGLVVVQGADVLDGKYSEQLVLKKLKFLKMSERFGKKTAITGFSFREDVQESIVNAFKLLTKCRLYLRDEHSFKRFQSKVGLGQLSADIAFCCPSAHAGNENTQAENYAGVIGINLNKLHVASEADQSKLIESIESLLKAYQAKHEIKKIILIPHDYRATEEKSDLSILKSLETKIVENGLVSFSCCTLITEELSPMETRSLAGQCEFLISGRMHLSILGFAGGVPSICFDYQGKFTGLFQKLQIDSLGLIQQPGSDIDNPSLVIDGVLKARSILTQSRNIAIEQAQQQLVEVSDLL